MQAARKNSEFEMDKCSVGASRQLIGMGKAWGFKLPSHLQEVKIVNH
jgi:hypothetical protein